MARTISSLTIGALLALAGCSHSPPQRQSVSDSVTLLRSGAPLQSVVDALCKPLVDSNQDAGIVVGVISKEGRKIFSYGSHLTHEALNGDSLFLVGSPTKMFTALLLETLMRDGVLPADATVGSIHQSGVVIKSKTIQDIRLWQLAAHVSGLPREILGLPMLWSVIKYPFDGHNFYGHLRTEDMLDYISDAELGTKVPYPYHYSNIGYSFLGWLMGNLDPRPGLSVFENYKRQLVEKVLLPLGLHDTVFDLSPAQENRLAIGHSGDFPPFWRRGLPIANWHVQDVMWPAGGLYSSANDLLSLLEINLGLIKSDFTETLKAAQVIRAPTKKGAVGMGWFIDPLPSTHHQAIYCDGISAGYSSFVGMDEQYKYGVVVLKNNIDLNDDVGITLLDRLAAGGDL